MNTNSLTRHYDQLTAPERLALVLAASARRDDVEQDRLMQTAPRIAFSAPHHFRLTGAFLLLSVLQFMDLLETAGAYCTALAAIPSKRKSETEAAWETVMLFGYLFNSRLAGWRQFCAELQLEPEVMWDMYPGHRTVQSAEQMASPNPPRDYPGPAFTEEGAARCLARKALGDPEAAVDEATLEKHRPVTAKDVAAGLRQVWEQLHQKWEA